MFATHTNHSKADGSERRRWIPWNPSAGVAEQHGAEARSAERSEANDRAMCADAVARKLEEYRKSDLMERNKRGNEPTIGLEEAMALIDASGGICGCCGCEMIMHSWPRKEPGVPAVFSPGFNKQFSFDRIDDNGTHSADNLRVCCLECNIRRADAVYDPDYYITIDEETTQTAYTEYERVKVIFNVFESMCIKGKIKKHLLLPVIDYHRNLKAYMAYLHDRIYGNFLAGVLISSRKPNNWKKFGIISSNNSRMLMQYGYIPTSTRAITFYEANATYYASLRNEIE